MRPCSSTVLLAASCLLLALGCVRPPVVDVLGGADGSAGATGKPDAGLDGHSDAPAGADGSLFELLGAPLIFAPTAHGFGLNVVLRSGEPSALRARVRAGAQSDWTDVGLPAVPATDIAQWSVGGLQAGQRYDYEIRADRSLYLGSAVTTRDPGASFSFAVLTDSHIIPRDPVPVGSEVGNDFNGFQESTLLTVASDVAAGNPDFILNMGDTLDFHMFGFNEPPPDSSWTRLAYLNFRRLLGDTLGHVAHFPVIGNWDGESGCNSQDEIQRSMSQRLLYVPGPQPKTYPQGGSPNEDYYAFTWGDALFVALNVMTYTPTCHLLDQDPGVPDDWTLGAAQLAWLDRTLAGATSKWRFLFIHHAVGGAAGDYNDSAYGRGGGQAAHVGEQATIHAMMLRYGVQIFFYGHDHVFTDSVVDGIHYSLPGSAGAPWKFDGSLTGYTQYWPDSGYGRVEIGPTQARITFIAAGGQVLSSYTLE